MSILAYHMVDPRMSWGITRIPPARFERQIIYALEQGYTFQTLSEYVQTGNHPKRLALTFDDGYESVYRFAYPILLKYDIPATVFIVPAFVGQSNGWDVHIGWQRFMHMTWNHIRELVKTGWEIGSHGMTHKDITKLDTKAAIREMKDSRQIVESYGILPSPYFSYPFGNSTPDTDTLARECGYRGTVVMGALHHSSFPFSIPRTGVYLFDSLKIFRTKMVASDNKILNLHQKVIDVCSNATVVYKRKNWQIESK